MTPEERRIVAILEGHTLYWCDDKWWRVSMWDERMALSDGDRVWVGHSHSQTWTSVSTLKEMFVVHVDRADGAVSVDRRTGNPWVSVGEDDYEQIMVEI